jgi:hypothetical protein
MEDVPNARAVSADGEKAEYGRVMESRLKVKWHARRARSWIEFAPGDLEVTLNDVPLLLDELVITIDPKGKLPRARIGFTMTELDIDADTMLALQAYVTAKGGTDQ